MALYIACMNQGLLDFYTGGKVLLQNNVDRRHILPRAQFAEEMRPSADNIANMAFIAGDVKKPLGRPGRKRQKRSGVPISRKSVYSQKITVD